MAPAANAKPSNRIIIEFPTPEDAEAFLGYMSDGGGEEGFVTDEGYLRFDYGQAFPAWGYRVAKHGPDRKIKVTRHED